MYNSNGDNESTSKSKMAQAESDRPTIIIKNPNDKSLYSRLNVFYYKLYKLNDSDYNYYYSI